MRFDAGCCGRYDADWLMEGAGPVLCTATRRGRPVRFACVATDAGVRSV